MIDDRAAMNLDIMLEACRHALSFTEGGSQDDFTGDVMKQRAVAMCLITIGESANRLIKRSPAFVKDHPDWPWELIRGLRNRIVHDYESVSLDVIWDTVKDSLPRLVTDIEALGSLDPRLRS